MKKICDFMKVGIIAGLFLFCNVLSAQFTNGNIVVLQAGDGTATYTGNVSAPGILQEFSPSGTPAFSVAIPTNSAGVGVSGNDITEGLITRSYDGHSIVIPGYNTASGTSNPSGTSATLVPRGIGAVNPAGAYSLAVTTNTFYSDNITTDGIGSATADGNGSFWGCGHVSGITAFSYNGSIPATTGSTILTNSPSQNTRAVAIYNGQLYYSTGSITHGLFMVGTGTPTAPTTVSLVVALGSPYQFAFSPNGNTLYIADKVAGVQKWTYSASTWTNNYTYSTTANSVRAIGLVADFSGANPIIYATTANGGSLVAIMDGGSLATSTVTTLATAPVNTSFRGVAFSPTCVVTSITSASGSGCTGSPLGLNVTALGTSLSYTWTGAGTINNANVSSPIVTGFSGNYTVTVKNACGTIASTVVIPTNSSPTLSPINNFTSCIGNLIALTPTLTPNGAGAGYTLTTPSGVTSLSTALAAIASAPAGTYPCTLAAQDAVGCISNTQAFILTLDLCTGIIEYSKLALTMAPNPAKESVEISFATNAGININIVNGLGQIVLTKNTNDTHVKLDVSGFPQGIYFVSITSGNQKEIKKLIVQ